MKQAKGGEAGSNADAERRQADHATVNESNKGVMDARTGVTENAQNLARQGIADLRAMIAEAGEGALNDTKAIHEQAAATILSEAHDVTAGEADATEQTATSNIQTADQTSQRTTQYDQDIAGLDDDAYGAGAGAAATDAAKVRHDIGEAGHQDARQTHDQVATDRQRVEAAKKLE